MKRGLQLPFKTSQKKNSTSPPKRKRQRERVFSGWNISRPKPFQTRLNFFSSQQIFLQSIKTFTSFFKHYFVFVLLLILILIQIQNDQRKKERKKTWDEMPDYLLPTTEKLNIRLLSKACGTNIIKLLLNQSWGLFH